MDSINNTKPPLALRPSSPSIKEKVFGTKANKYQLHKFFSKIVLSVSSKKISSSAAPTAEYVTSSIKTAQYTIQTLDKADKSDGVRAALKITNAAGQALTGAAYASYSAAQPLALIDVLKKSTPTTSGPSLVGRVSAGFNSFATQLGNIAVVFFMMATGYKIYESGKWCHLTQDELHQKIQPPTIVQIGKKYKGEGDNLKKLVYDYFEDRIHDVLKKGKKVGLEADLQDRKDLEVQINEQIDSLLAQESGFIQDEKAWEECINHREQNKVEAFGLYIQVMLARQSHRQEMKRVFGKEGMKIIGKMQQAKAADPKLYAKAMTICRQRLVLDTMNFVLGIGVMSLMVFSASAALVLPLLAKVSKSSVNFEYFSFALKALIMGTVVFTPYGATALTLFATGFFIYNVAQLGLSYLPFMESKEFDNYTRYDKLLIKINIVLSIISFISTGFVGMYTDVSLITTAALASTQLPWLGLNTYALSQIWKKEEEKKEALKSEIEEVTDQKDIDKLIDKYGFDLVQKAFLNNSNGATILKTILFPEEIEFHTFLGQEEEGEMVSKKDLETVEELLKEFKKRKKEREAFALKEELREHYLALARAGLIKSVN